MILCQDTEVAIAPKLRHKIKSSNEDHVESTTPNNGPNRTNVLLRAFPYGLYSLPAKMASGGYPKVWVSCQTYKQLTGIRNILQETPLHFSRCVRLDPPISPLESAEQTKQEVTPREEPKFLKPTAAVPRQKEVERISDVSNILPLGWSSDIPDHHALVWGLNEIHELDIVSYVNSVIP